MNPLRELAAEFHIDGNEHAAVRLETVMREMGWRPIETAPEGRNVVVWCNGSWHKAMRRGTQWKRTSNYSLTVQPTHWLEIEPPTEESK